VARSGPEVADVFRRYGDTYRQRHDLPRVQRRVMQLAPNADRID
jgi:hypothetical protein